MNNRLNYLKITIWIYLISGVISTFLLVLFGGYDHQQSKGIAIVFFTFLLLSSMIFYYFVKKMLRLGK
ncbi:hypothetical protein JOC75_000660 [Metabacillus crassostreae]|uniref:hypothetical protein n=1 Tax=Metabacillus crassostreae TaxID=929098 RepID=UPI00195BA42D|nr:hypothetical protein [Metabacillus crassostreae]MBM7602690.1 hypothetical protein [Metabacillus crassostreae]